MPRDWHSDNSSTHITPPPAPRVAPAWHTITLLGFLIALAIYGATYGATTTASASSAPYTVRFLISCIQRVFLLGAVIGGIDQRRVFLESTLLYRGRSWTNEFCTGLIVYFLGLAASVIAIVIRLLLHQSVHEINPGLLSVLPHTATQLPVWFLVSLVAGIGEELIFRGYLLRQFTAWTGSVPLAVTAISVLFGAMHLYEGLPVVVALMLLSVLYCMVVLHRGNLRAVMIAHTLQDFLAGLAGLLLPHMERLHHHL